MGNILIAFMVALYSFQAFSLTYQVSGVRKTVLNIPKQIFENSIPFKEIAPDQFLGYFDKPILEALLDEYFNDSLKKFTQKYEVSYLYYQTSDGLYCKGDYCDGIKVYVTANVAFSFSVEENMFYEIKETRL